MHIERRNFAGLILIHIYARMGINEHARVIFITLV